MGLANKVELQVGANTSKAQASMAAFGNWLKTGFGIDIAGRLNSALMRIPAALQQAIETGIRFNSMLEDSELGIAGLLRAIARSALCSSLDAALAASRG